jgi:HEAT repeat protein
MATWAAPPALAQGGDEAEQSSEGEASTFPSLSSRFGLERLVSALAAASLEERLGAIQRLAGLATPVARHRLVNGALERRAQLDPREWLSLVRVLAPHAHEDEPRVLLALAMNLRATEPAGPANAALLGLVRGSAALALAASGSEPALRVLGAALRGGGPGAALAAEALLQHPPADLALLLAVPGEPSVELARWLGELGDQRAFHPLRAWVRGESAEVRAAAAIALTQLGALETVPLARSWQRSGVPVLERAALQIALLTQQPEAGEWLLQRLRTEPQEATALGLALSFPSAELLPWAAETAGVGAAERMTLLGRIGGPAAARLEAALGTAEGAFHAARALSRMASKEGAAALQRALAARVAPPLVARAAVLRERLWQEKLTGLPEQLARLRASQLPVERAAGAWGSSLRGSEAALAELGSGDAVRVEAAANNALCFDDEVLAAAARQLSQAAPGRARVAFAFALLRPSGAQAISSELLSSLVLEGGVAAPLALRALAARAEPHFQALAAGYLTHSDPLLRTHVARGLGESQRPDAVGLLTRSFEYETDEVVRQAMVRALSLRRGPAVRRTLELAARLDPSPRVRGAAQLALSGVELRDPPPESEAFWTEQVFPEAPEQAQKTEAASPGAGETSERAGSGERGIPREGKAQAGGAQAGGAQAGGAQREGAARAGGVQEKGGAPKTKTNAVGLLHVLPGLALPVFADAAGILVAAGVGVEPLGLRWQSSEGAARGQ